MASSKPTVGIDATPVARNAISALRATHGTVMFVLSAGCCGGSAPMCYPLGEYLTGPGDILLGEIDGCPFYVDARHYEAFGEPDLVLDVQAGFAEGFSLPAAPGQRFIARTTSRAARAPD